MSTQLLPVRIAEAISDAGRIASPYSGAIHIEIGRVRIHIEGSADPESLRIVLERLSR